MRPTFWTILCLVFLLGGIARAEAPEPEDGLSEMTGTIRDVDQAARSLLVQADDGRRLKLVAGPRLQLYNEHNEAETFDALHEHDRVRVRYDAKTLLAKEIDEL